MTRRKHRYLRGHRARQTKEDDMFAVLKTGGKQYRVKSGDVLRVEKLAADAGETIQFNEILMVGATVGTPFVADAGVQAEVIDQIKGEKVIHFVKRRRKHSSKRTKGHRQQLTLLRITDIMSDGAGKSGVKAAIGSGGIATDGSSDGRYAENRADQAEMKKRVTEGEAKEKPAGAAASGDAGADDLKRLSGVGPALEKKLHAAGVTGFAQIAAWGDDDIAKFNTELNFKGRIEREGWVDQAASFEAEKE